MDSAPLLPRSQQSHVPECQPSCPASLPCVTQTLWASTAGERAFGKCVPEGPGSQALGSTPEVMQKPSPPASPIRKRYGMGRKWTSPLDRIRDPRLAAGTAMQAGSATETRRGRGSAVITGCGVTTIMNAACAPTGVPPSKTPQREGRGSCLHIRSDFCALRCRVENHRVLKRCARHSALSHQVTQASLLPPGAKGPTFQCCPQTFLEGEGVEGAMHRVLKICC